MPHSKFLAFYKGHQDGAVSVSSPLASLKAYSEQIATLKSWERHKSAEGLRGHRKGIDEETLHVSCRYPRGAGTGCKFLWNACQRLPLRDLAHQRPLVTSATQGGEQPAFLCKLQPTAYSQAPFLHREGRLCPRLCLSHLDDPGGGSSASETDC